MTMRAVAAYMTILRFLEGMKRDAMGERTRRGMRASETAWVEGISVDTQSPIQLYNWM